VLSNLKVRQKHWAIKPEMDPAKYLIAAIGYLAAKSKDPFAVSLLPVSQWILTDFWRQL